MHNTPCREVQRLSRRHHKLASKEFQEQTKQEQGKYYLSEQLSKTRRSNQLKNIYSWKMTRTVKKDKDTSGKLKGNSGKQ